MRTGTGFGEGQRAERAAVGQLGEQLGQIGRWRDRDRHDGTDMHQVDHRRRSADPGQRSDGRDQLVRSTAEAAGLGRNGQAEQSALAQRLHGLGGVAALDVDVEGVLNGDLQNRGQTRGHIHKVSSRVMPVEGGCIRWSRWQRHAARSSAPISPPVRFSPARYQYRATLLPCCAAEPHKADMNVEWVIGEARPAD